jgi:hypothetical protein
VEVSFISDRETRTIASSYSREEGKRRRGKENGNMIKRKRV